MNYREHLQRSRDRRTSGRHSVFNCYSPPVGISDLQRLMPSGLPPEN